VTKEFGLIGREDIVCGGKLFRDGGRVRRREKREPLSLIFSHMRCTKFDNFENKPIVDYDNLVK